MSKRFEPSQKCLLLTISESISVQPTCYLYNDRYARKHGYPVLEHVALPRIGALQTILKTLSPSETPHVTATANGATGNSVANGGPTTHAPAANGTLTAEGLATFTLFPC